MLKEEQYLANLSKTLKEQGYGKRYSNLCIQYAARILKNNLPVIFDLKHLALLLGIKKDYLCSLIFSDEKYIYKTIKIPKRRKGYRELSLPNTNLKYIQRWILKNILDKITISIFATGFQKGESIVTNAEKHLNQECIINLDIKDFFPSITLERIFKIFYYYGYTKEVSFLLAKLCIYHDSLPQGAPTSPKLSNICCLKLDKRLSKLCEKYEANYTRYADDITISGGKAIGLCIDIIDKILSDEGFTLNKEKTRIAYKYNRQEVTGLNLNSGKVTISKDYKKELSKEIYFCKKYGVESHLKHIKCNKAFYKEHLYGKVCFINMVEPEIANKMFEELKQINWNY